MAGSTSVEVRHLGESPRPPALLVSFAIHLAVLLLIVLAVRQERSAQLLLAQNAQPSSPSQTRARSTVMYLPPTSTASQATVSFPSKAQRLSKRARVHETPNTSETAATQELRQSARQRTAAITNSLRIRGIYGFAPGAEYGLAVQTAGEFPRISAAEVPPRFEQYVQIEVTIDKDGHVADARIIAGEVDRKIQEKLLAAVREFRYTPATRNGSPIPSQRDIIIHIPS